MKKNIKDTDNNQDDKVPGIKIGDDLIAVIRELVQLSLLTGTNLVDHMRAVRVEVVDNTIVPTEQYVKDYNTYIEELERQAEALQAVMQEQEAGDQEPGSFN